MIFVKMRLFKILIFKIKINLYECFNVNIQILKLMIILMNLLFIYNKKIKILFMENKRKIY